MWLKHALLVVGLLCLLGGDVPYPSLIRSVSAAGEDDDDDANSSSPFERNGAGRKPQRGRRSTSGVTTHRSSSADVRESEAANEGAVALTANHSPELNDALYEDYSKKRPFDETTTENVKHIPVYVSNVSALSNEHENSPTVETATSTAPCIHEPVYISNVASLLLTKEDPYSIATEEQKTKRENNHRRRHHGDKPMQNASALRIASAKSTPPPPPSLFSLLALVERDKEKARDAKTSNQEDISSLKSSSSLSNHRSSISSKSSSNSTSRTIRGGNRRIPQPKGQSGGSERPSQGKASSRGHPSSP